MNKFEEFTKICTVMNQFTEQRIELYELIVEVVNYIRDQVYSDSIFEPDCIFESDYMVKPHHIFDVGTLKDNPDICSVTFYRNDDFQHSYFPVKFLCDDFKEKYAKELDEFIQSYLKNINQYKIVQLEQEIKHKQQHLAVLKANTFTDANDDMVKLIDNYCLGV